MTGPVHAPWRPWLWSAVALLLLLPALAMQLGDAVNWGLADFALAALLLGGAAALFELAAARIRRPGARALVAAALVAAVLLIWAEEAVGLM